MTRQEAPAWQCVLEARAEVGECPIWCPEKRALYWIDIYGPALFRTNPESGATRRWGLPSPVGCFGLREARRRT